MNSQVKVNWLAGTPALVPGSRRPRRPKSAVRDLRLPTRAEEAYESVRRTLTVTPAGPGTAAQVRSGSKYLPVSLRWAPSLLSPSHGAHGLASGVRPHPRA